MCVCVGKIMCGYKVFLSVFVCLIVIPSFSNSDNNQALLLTTLKTMHRAACDDEQVSLACPRGTSVSIQLAQYGKSMDINSCVGRSLVDTGSTDRCLLPNSMQYSLLKTVIEVCQKKPSCKFTTKLKAGLVDPCPGTRKFVEVAYKCSPVEFRKREVCQDDMIRLTCNPYSRVAIYEAQYGRLANEPLTCHIIPQELSNETCWDPRATMTVRNMCHGKRRCEVLASSERFKAPCNRNTRAILKVAYTCVPLGVLTETYENALQNDEMATNEASGSEHDQDHDDLFDENDAGEKWIEPTVIPAAPVANPPFLTTPEAASDARLDINGAPVVSIHNTKRSADEVQGSGTYVLLYIAIAIGIFIILTLTLIVVRCYIITRSSRGSKSNDMYTTQPPNVFNDTVSDIDNDVEVSHISGTFYEHPDMILYRDIPGNKGTLRAMRPVTSIYPSSSMYGPVDYVPSHSRVESDVSRRAIVENEKDSEMVVSPKSLSRYSSPNFYYG